MNARLILPVSILALSLFLIAPLSAIGEVLYYNFGNEFDEDCDDGGVGTSGCELIEDNVNTPPDTCMWDPPLGSETVICTENHVKAGWTCPVDEVCQNLCGNGVLDGVCSDNGLECTRSDLAGCFDPNTAVCVLHEECDDGGLCSDNSEYCTLQDLSACGNPATAACVTQSDNNCISTCQSTGTYSGSAFCGDGVLNHTDEECDDGGECDDNSAPCTLHDLSACGNSSTATCVPQNGDGCRNDCTLQGSGKCGDDLVNAIDEMCDGSDNGNCGSGSCTGSCLCDYGCGDGIGSNDPGYIFFPLQTGTGHDFKVSGCADMSSAGEIFRAYPMRGLDQFDNRLVGVQDYSGMSVFRSHAFSGVSGDLPAFLGGIRFDSNRDHEFLSATIEGGLIFVGNGGHVGYDVPPVITVFDLRRGECSVSANSCTLGPDPLADDSNCTGTLDYCGPLQVGGAAKYVGELIGGSQNQTLSVAASGNLVAAGGINTLSGTRSTTYFYGAYECFSGSGCEMPLVGLSQISDMKDAGCAPVPTEPSIVGYSQIMGDLYVAALHSLSATDGGLAVVDLKHAKCRNTWGEYLHHDCDMTIGYNTCPDGAVCAPRTIGYIPIPGEVISVEVRNGVAFVANGGPSLEPGWSSNFDRLGGGLAVIDISDCNTGDGCCTLDSLLPSPYYLSTPGIATGLALRDNRAYVADNTNGLVVVDISNCGAGSTNCDPRIIGGHRTSAIAGDRIQGEAWDVVLAGSTAFLSGAFRDTNYPIELFCDDGSGGYEWRRFFNILAVNISENNRGGSDCARTQVCGDGTKDTWEICDDNNTSNGSNGDCTGDCLAVQDCGNGVVEGSEVCDDLNDVSDGEGHCTYNCLTVQICGNSSIEGSETCDDGNTVSEGNGFCTANCLASQDCGNSAIEGTETCDDGNSTAYDGCSATCQLECGNGTTEGSEFCDEGAYNGTGQGHCTADCAIVQTCGNSSTEGTEACDDGNTTDGGEESCVADCSAWERCGDGVTNGLEECDSSDWQRYIATDGTYYGLASNGSRIFAGAQGRGFEVWNQSTGVLLDQFNDSSTGFGSDAGQVKLSGNRLIAASGLGGVGILEYDSMTDTLAMPGTPLSSSTTVGYVTDVEISGDLAFATSLISFVGHLLVIDISGDTPSLVTSLTMFNNKPALALSLYSGKAYIANVENGTTVVDLSSCTSAGSCSLSALGSGDSVPPKNTGDQVWDVAVANGYAYAANRYNGVQVIDLSSAPGSEVAFWSDNTSGLTRIVVRSNTAYVGSNYVGLHLLNISNPLSISLTQEFLLGNTRGLYALGSDEILIGLPDIGMLRLKDDYLDGTFTCAWGCHCGNGTVENPEACDEGTYNGTSGHCNTTCSGMVP